MERKKEEKDKLDADGFFKKIILMIENIWIKVEAIGCGISPKELISVYLCLSAANQKINGKLYD